MPKRIIDGEGVWNSLKLGRVEPVRFRAEYTNLLPLALANGSFECEPRLVWKTVYALNRPDITVDDVVNIFDEFERVKLVFRWPANGKPWAYWVGIDKQGRLPTTSRLEGRHETVGERVPQDKLQSFLMDAVGQPTEDDGLTNGEPAVSLGFGFGFGVGSGSGQGAPETNGVPMDSPDDRVLVISSTPHLAATWVCEQLSLSGKTMRSLLTHVIEQEQKAGSCDSETQLIAEALVRSRRAYEDFPNKSVTYSPRAFFEQGIFKQSKHWGGNHAATASDRHRRDFQSILERAADRDLEQLNAHHAERDPHH